MQLFRFANPDYFYLLLVIPVIVALYVYNRGLRSRRLRRAGDEELLNGLIPEYSGSRSTFKFVTLMLALVSGTVMLAGPQFGSKIREVKREGVEIIIALDVSNSMMAEDIQPNRLERAKQSISRLVDRLEDDRIGLIVFAGDAYTQVPVTTDYISAKMFLNSINPGIVPKQGTSIGSAINLGMSSFSPSSRENRVMVIITDGENHEEDPMEAVELAKEKGITIHTIGIGSVAGVPVPVNGGARDYLKDHEGNTVISKLDEEVLRKIAFATGGKYVKATNSSLGLNSIFDEITSMKGEEMESTLFSEYNDQFQVLALIMLIFIVIDFITMERKNRQLSRINLFEFRI